MSTKFEKERLNYPVLAQYAYLDSATTGAIPQYGCDAICDYLQHRTQDGMDIDYYHAQWDWADEVREEIAELLGAESCRQIAYGQNSSTLFNIFYNGLNFQRGDNVIIYRNAFPAMTYQCLNLQERLGVELRVVEATDGNVAPEQLFALADEHTRAITVCHVDSGTGYRHDLATIGHWCRRHHIPFGVDATQSCGAMEIDVQAMDVDFLTASCYKWLQGVQGLAFAYIAPRLMPELAQTDMGWANVKDRVNGDPFELLMCDSACRFENGGLPAPGLYGLSKVLHTYQNLGGRDIQNYILELVDYLYHSVAEVPNVSITFPYDEAHRSNLVCVTVPSSWGITDATLRAHGLRARAQRPDRIRLGIHYYNNCQDIDALMSYFKTF